MAISAGPVKSEAAGGMLWRTRFGPPASGGPVRGAAVLLHGLGDHGGRYGEALVPWVERGLVVEAFDWRGHGRSPGPRGVAGTPDEVMAAALEVVERLRTVFPGRPLGIVAHSTGALLALRMMQERRFVPAFAWINAPLLDPSAGQPFWKPLAARSLARWLPGLRVPTGVRRADCIHEEPSAEGEGSAPVDPLRHGRVLLRFGAGLLREAALLRERIDRFADLETGILFTQGLEDPVCPPALMETFFERLPAPGKRLERFPGLRHEGFADRGRERLLGAVGEWLDGVAVPN